MDAVIELSIDGLIDFVKSEENEFIIHLQLETEVDANAEESI